MKNVYLVGFMAAGKTTVGKKLAKNLNKDFIDLDDMIEQKENMPIVDIFKQKGELYFRQAEKDIVKETAKRTDLIVGCGGGAVIDSDNLDTLKKSGIVICLKADIDTLLERSRGALQRPLLNVDNPKEHIKELLDKRGPFYNQADYVIDTTNLKIEEVVDKIMEIIAEVKSRKIF